MNDSIQFQRWAGISTLLAVPMALGSGVLLLITIHWDAGVLSNPGSIISMGPGNAELLRWGMILDVLGYYLLLAPLALHLWNWLKPHSPSFVTLYTLCGLGYILIGAMGAIVLSAVLPPLVIDYARASPQRREFLQVIFSSFLNAVYLGLWNPLEALLFGIWLSGIGVFIQRERRVLGIISRALGFFALLDAIGRFLNIDIVFFIGVAGMLAFPVWLPWLGLDLIRAGSPSSLPVGEMGREVIAK